MAGQIWVGERDACSGHMMILANLMEKAVSQGLKDSFEADMFLTLSVPVVRHKLFVAEVISESHLGTYE
jgi:hypothetical protein